MSLPQSAVTVVDPDEAVSGKIVVRPRWRSAHAGVTVLLCALFALMYLDRVNLSAAAPAIKAEFNLTNAQLGIAFSAFSWAYLATVLFGGWGARKFGARATLLICGLIVGAA